MIDIKKIIVQLRYKQEEFLFGEYLTLEVHKVMHLVHLFRYSLTYYAYILNHPLILN